MDDFLLDAPKSNYACHSIEDLQLQFARLCEEKVTETRSEHISATYEFPSTVIFNIIENQNDGADANQNLDSAPAGSSGVISEAPPNENGGATPAPREIRAHDTIMNQPTDDPTLQKAVAKHIITCLGAVDGSAWTVRSLSRGPLGWTFQYLCKSSVQAWQRQNSKNPAKVLVGESSGKDGQDPINLGEQPPYSSDIDRVFANSPSSPSCFRLSRNGHYCIRQEQSIDNSQARAHSTPQDCGRPLRTLQATTPTSTSGGGQEERGRGQEEENPTRPGR